MYHFRKDHNNLPPTPYTHSALSYSLKRHPSLIALLTFLPESACHICLSNFILSLERNHTQWNIRIYLIPV